MEKDKQTTLSWRAGLGLFFGSVLVASLFFFSGNGELARPTIYSIFVIGIAASMRWELKNRLWFWFTIVFIAILHIPLILLIPWGTRWFPAIIAVPFCLVDLAIMLAIFNLAKKLIDSTNRVDSED